MILTKGRKRLNMGTGIFRNLQKGGTVNDVLWAIVRMMVKDFIQKTLIILVLKKL